MQGDSYNIYMAKNCAIENGWARRHPTSCINQQHCEVLTGQGLHHRELDSEECAHEVLEWWAKV